jgi:hypothetical protein
VPSVFNWTAKYSRRGITYKKRSKRKVNLGKEIERQGKAEQGLAWLNIAAYEEIDDNNKTTTVLNGSYGKIIKLILNNLRYLRLK